jgi:hypothetical protein
LWETLYSISRTRFFCCLKTRKPILSTRRAETDICYRTTNIQRRNFYETLIPANGHRPYYGRSI